MSRCSFSLKLWPICTVLSGVASVARCFRAQVLKVCVHGASPSAEKYCIKKMKCEKIVLNLIIRHNMIEPGISFGSYFRKVYETLKLKTNKTSSLSRD